MQAGAKIRHHNNGQKQIRKGQNDIHDAHNDVVQSTLVVTGNGTEQGSQDKGQSHTYYGHNQRNPGTVNYPGKDIPPQIVCTENILFCAAIGPNRRLDLIIE